MPYVFHRAEPKGFLFHSKSPKEISDRLVKLCKKVVPHMKVKLSIEYVRKLSVHKKSATDLCDAIKKNADDDSDDASDDDSAKNSDSDDHGSESDVSNVCSLPLCPLARRCSLDGPTCAPLLVRQVSDESKESNDSEWNDSLMGSKADAKEDKLEDDAQPVDMSSPALQKYIQVAIARALAQQAATQAAGADGDVTITGEREADATSADDVVIKQEATTPDATSRKRAQAELNTVDNLIDNEATVQRPKRAARGQRLSRTL